MIPILLGISVVIAILPPLISFFFWLFSIPLKHEEFLEEYWPLAIGAAVFFDLIWVILYVIYLALKEFSTVWREPWVLGMGVTILSIAIIKILTSWLYRGRIAKKYVLRGDNYLTYVNLCRSLDQPTVSERRYRRIQCRYA